MSALADYTAAQAQEKYSQAALNNANIGLVKSQDANFDQNAVADRAAKFGSAAAGFGSGAASQANAAATPGLAASEVSKNNAGANDANAAADATRVTSGALTQKLPGEIAQQNLQNQGTATENTFKPDIFRSTLASQGASTAVSGLQLQRLSDAQIAAAKAGQGNSGGLFDYVQRVAAAAGNGLFGSSTPTSTLPTDPITGRPIGQEKGGVAGRDTNPPGKTDTIPTMLAPGEAVINAHAVEHYGTDVIDHMNKMGALRGAAKDELAQMAETMKKGGKAKVGRPDPKA